MAENVSKPTVELAAVGVTIMPVLKGMAKQIRSAVSEGAKGSAQAISAEINRGLAANTKKMRSNANDLAKTYRQAFKKPIIAPVVAGSTRATGSNIPGQNGRETRRQRRERLAAEREEQNALLKEQATNIARTLSKGIGGAFATIGRGLTGLGSTFGRGIGRMLGTLAPTLRTISGGIRGLGASMMNYIVPPATAAAAAVAAVGANAIRTGVQYNTLQQTTRAGLKTLLGSAEAANKQMDLLNEFTSTSPFAKQTFIEAQQGLLAFNFAAEEVIPTLDAIQNQVAAMGGSNQQIREIATIFGKIRSSQLISMEDINQLAERGINAPKLLAEYMKVSEEAMREDLMGDPVRGRDAIDALNIIINSMAENNRGAAEGVKNTWVGAIDRIKAAWRDAASWLMTPFVDPMGGGLGIEWANSIADSLRQIERAIREFVTANRGEIEAFFEPVSRSLRNTTEALREFNGSDISRFLTNVGAMKDVLLPLAVFFTAVFGSSMLAGIPLIGSLVPAIGPLVGAVLAVSSVSPELRAAIGDLFRVITEGIPPLLPVLELLISVLEHSFVSTIRFITPYVEQFMQILPGLVVGFLEFITQVVGASGEMLPILAEIAQVVGNALLTAFYAVLPYLPIIAGAMVELGYAVGEALREIWATLGPNLPDIINTLVGAFLLLVDVLIDLLPLMVELVNFAIENHEAFFMLATFAFVAWNALKVFLGAKGLFTILSGLIGSITTALSGVTLASALATAGVVAAAAGAAVSIGLLMFGLYQIFKDPQAFIDGFFALLEGVDGLAKGVANWIGSLVGSLLSSIDQMLQGAARGIGSFLADIGNWIGDVFDPTYGWITGRTNTKGYADLQVPRYANGGLVPATPGGRLLIAGEAGRNEIIADEGLFNKNLELQNRALAGVMASGAEGRAPVVVENITIVAAQNESNETLLKRVRRTLQEPDLAAGY